MDCNISLLLFQSNMCAHPHPQLRPDGKKKAYVRLPKNKEALEVANTIGII